MNARLPMVALATALGLSGPTHAADSADYRAIPPFLAVNMPKPNVLVVLDTSNSMDENVGGAAVGSSSGDSRSEIARHAIKGIIDNFGSQMRFGLMGYRQSSIASRQIHNAFYHLSHDPSTLGTDNDDFTPLDQESNTKAYDLSGHTVYYDQALPYYSSSNEGQAYCYSTNYRPRGDGVPPATMNGYISQDNPYRCCRGKSGTNDIEPDGVNDTEDAAAIGEYSSCFGTYNFGLTDSDVAAGFWQIGAQIAWNYVGAACLSTTTPGGGYLHVPIADSDSAQLANLEAKLGTWSGSCSSDTPLRNAGFTPLATTLGSAKDYFEGDLESDYGGPQSSPVEYTCQRNFVVLVTDGLPTEDINGDGDLIRPVVDAAAALRSLDVAVGAESVNCDVQTFVLGFALPRGMDGVLDPVAVAGGTDVNGAAYYAGSQSELLAKLNTLFLEILNRTSSGTATAINLSSFRGEGMAVRATFQPQMTDTAGNEVAWGGHLNALLIDDAGSLHEDDGDKALGSAATDPYVDMCYNESTGVVRVKTSTSEAGRPTELEIQACNPGVFDLGLSDLRYLWDAGAWLAAIPNTSGDVATQRIYTANDEKRYVFTSLDGASTTDFVAASFDSSNSGLLLAADTTKAGEIVNFIRGLDQAGYRSRQILLGGPSTVTWRLGDIVYSSPSVVGRPAESFDLIYRDTSYGDFFAHYKNRRQVVYVGANDGMLHAFNGGFYDTEDKRFRLAPEGAGGVTQYALGAELWAYVPYNVLPHLKYLSNPGYGTQDGDHLYYVDLKPRIFDAKIFGNDGVTGQPGANVHPNGWGTVLAVGMRFGGGEMTVDADLGADNDSRTLRSAFILLDVTDPEQPPALLTEFTHPELGFTTTLPAPVTVCRETGGYTPPDCGSDADWYLLLGSGPHPANPAALNTASSDQPGKLFLLNLKTMALEPGFDDDGIAALSDNDSFVSDLIAVDYNLDYSADAVYFGTVNGSTGSWGGNLQRIRIVDNESAGAWTYKTVSNWSPSLLFDTGKPVTAMPSIGLDRSDNRWIFAGSGRFIVDEDAMDSSAQHYYGVKEPRDADGDFNWGTATSLLDVSGAKVFQNSEDLTGVSATVTSGSICPAGTVDTFDELECFLRQYSHSADFKDGWISDFPSAGERNLSQAALLSGALAYTSYQPSTVICESEGESALNVVYFGTGTAYKKPVIGLGSTQFNGNFEIKVREELGRGLALSPSLHSGQGYDAQGGPGRNIKAFVQTSTGLTKSVEMTMPFTVRPGEINWREHED